MLLGTVILVDILSIFILAFSLTYIAGRLAASFVYSFIMILMLFIIPIVMNKTKVTHRFGKVLSRHLGDSPNNLKTRIIILNGSV